MFLWGHWFIGSTLHVWSTSRFNSWPISPLPWTSYNVLNVEKIITIMFSWWCCQCSFYSFIHLFIYGGGKYVKSNKSKGWRLDGHSETIHSALLWDFNSCFSHMPLQFPWLHIIILIFIFKLPFYCWLNVPDVPGSTSEHQGHKYELRDVFDRHVRHLLPSLLVSLLFIPFLTPGYPWMIHYLCILYATCVLSEPDGGRGCAETPRL